MHDPALSRFYGMAVPSSVAAVRSESLTTLDETDLFVAHMRGNYGYFGGLDKTLSGFVVLSDEGDDAWLLDLRGTGAVYFQRHEDRTVKKRYPTFEAYLATRENAKGSISVDVEAFAPTKRTVSTPALLDRLQWAVWFFAQPMDDDLGTDAETNETRKGVERFVQTLGIAPRSGYAKERKALAGDVHLACSWMLVAAALADEAWAKDITDQGPRDSPLFTALVAHLAQLGVSGTLEVLPVFVRRKAALLSALAAVNDSAVSVGMWATSLGADSGERPLRRALLMVEVAQKHAAMAQVEAAAREIPESPATIAMRAFCDIARGQRDSDHVRAAVALVGDASIDHEDKLTLFERLSPHLADPTLRLALARPIVARDPYHFMALGMAAEAARITELPEADDYARRYGLLSRIRPLYLRCRRGHAEVEAALAEAAALTEPDRPLFVARVLAAPAAFADAVVEAALLWSMDLPSPERAAQWQRALGALGFPSAPAAAKALRLARPVPDSALAADLRTLVASSLQVPGAPLLGRIVHGDATKILSGWLTASGDASAIDDLLERLEHSDSATQEAIINSALNRFDDEGNFILDKMSDMQAQRAARLLIALQQPGMDGREHLFYAAGRQLYRFDHRGAEALLIEHLRLESEKDLVANLYSAVRNMNTDRARTALTERLFEEKSSHWRMADAISEIWTEAIHGGILDAIEQRRSRDGLDGANHYATTLVEHAPARVEALMQLAARVVDWQPRDATEARKLAYILRQTGAVALQHKNEEDAWRFLQAADALQAEPLSNYWSSRGKVWPDPLLKDKKLQHKLGVLARKMARSEAKAKAKRAGDVAR